MLIGNHFFQGDDETAGVRGPGLSSPQTNIKTLMTGNYIDNCAIEWSNEHDAQPEFSNEFSFGGLTVTGNIFTVNDAASCFRWIVVTPRGPGHFIHGLNVSGNVFRTVNCTIDRIEKVDTTHASLDLTRMRNVVFEANAFNGISQTTVSPVVIRAHPVDGGGHLGGERRGIPALRWAGADGAGGSGRGSDHDRRIGRALRPALCPARAGGAGRHRQPALARRGSGNASM